MQRYVFKDGGAPRRKDADPQVYGEALEALRDKHGVIHADDVWRAAQHHGHPMHDEFVWDRDKAAEGYWRHRARKLITMVMVVDNDDDNRQPMQAYYNARVGTPARRTYISSETIVNDHLLQMQQVAMALRELRDFKRRFARLIVVSQPIDAAVAEVERLLEEAEMATHRPRPSTAA